MLTRHKHCIRAFDVADAAEGIGDNLLTRPDINQSCGLPESGLNGGDARCGAGDQIAVFLADVGSIVGALDK